jgi:hypothetical protein
MVDFSYLPFFVRIYVWERLKTSQALRSTYKPPAPHIHPILSISKTKNLPNLLLLHLTLSLSLSANTPNRISNRLTRRCTRVSLFYADEKRKEIENSPPTVSPTPLPTPPTVSPTPLPAAPTMFPVAAPALETPEPTAEVAVPSVLPFFG